MPLGPNIGPTKPRTGSFKYNTSDIGKDEIPQGYELGKISQFDKRQNALYKSLYPHLAPDSYLSRLAGGGDEQMWNEIEAPAHRQFQQLQGQTASRFSGLGMGSRHGSGFKNYANQQSIDFATQLKSQRHDLSRQAMRDLFEMSNMLLGQRPYEKFLAPEGNDKKLLGGWGSTVGGLGGAAVGGYASKSPEGAMAGYQVGSNALSGL